MPPNDGKDLKEAIDQAIGSIVSQQQRGEIVGRLAVVLEQEIFSGPMPHPRHLREYEEILPGAAERILAMAEANLAHSRKMNETVVGASIDDRKRGMTYGLSALLAACVGAGFCAYIEQPIVAGLFIAAPMLGAVGIFVKGRIEGRDEQRGK